MDSKDWEKSKEADIKRKFKLEVHIKVVLEKKDEMILMSKEGLKRDGELPICTSALAKILSRSSFEITRSFRSGLI